MLWHEITVQTTEEAIEMISNFLHELGAGGVAIEESGVLTKERDTSFGQLYDKPLNDIPEGRCVIQGYFSLDIEMETVMNQLKESVDQLAEFEIDTGNPVYNLRTVDDEDWADAWKQYFKPIRISERPTIKPTWEDYEATPEEIILELDPGMAFGTGTHATTALCLRALEKVIKSGDEVIDVGTGSGVLAIAAAKLGARHVLALDLDPVAVTIAGENTAVNKLEERITLIQSDLLQAIRVQETGGSTIHGVTLPVAVVVANILAEIIVLFVDDVYTALQPGGTYITSGIIKAKQGLVEEALVKAGFEMESVEEEADWVALVARKR